MRPILPRRDIITSSAKLTNERQRLERQSLGPPPGAICTARQRHVATVRIPCRQGAFNRDG